MPARCVVKGCNKGRNLQEGIALSTILILFYIFQSSISCQIIILE